MSLGLRAWGLGLSTLPGSEGLSLGVLLVMGLRGKRCFMIMYLFVVFFLNILVFGIFIYYYFLGGIEVKAFDSGVSGFRGLKDKAFSVPGFGAFLGLKGLRWHCTKAHDHVRLAGRCTLQPSSKSANSTALNAKP